VNAGAAPPSPPPCRAFVISLATAGRWANYSHLPWLQRQDAVDTKNTDPRAAAAEYGLTLNLGTSWHRYFRNNKGATGCFLSHLLLWRRVAQDPDPARWYLVLEDDVDVESVARVWANYPPAATEPGVDAELVNLNDRGPNGAEAYLLRPPAAAKLLALCGGAITMPLDKYVGRCSCSRTL
jgi:hypothetical protein